MKTFKLGFYPAAVLPFIIAFLTNASCTVGLVTATEEASGLVTYGPEHSAHLQGGLLGDGGQRGCGTCMPAGSASAGRLDKCSGRTASQVLLLRYAYGSAQPSCTAGV
jgi:hypothetical protein